MHCSGFLSFKPSVSKSLLRRRSIEPQVKSIFQKGKLAMFNKSS